jgi:hypothetical protein
MPSLFLTLKNVFLSLKQTKSLASNFANFAICLLSNSAAPALILAVTVLV